MTAFNGRPVWAASAAVFDGSSPVPVADLTGGQRTALEATICSLLSGVGTGDAAWLTGAPNPWAVIARRQISDREWEAIGDAPSSCSAAPGQVYVPLTNPGR
jgi:hypothetical protein